jgi:hypothetical protein
MGELWDIVITYLKLIGNEVAEFNYMRIFYSSDIHTYSYTHLTNLLESILLT